MSRLLRKVMDRVYVSGLRKEGYDDVRAPLAGRRREATVDTPAESPLRAPCASAGYGRRRPPPAHSSSKTQPERPSPSISTPDSSSPWSWTSTATQYGAPTQPPRPPAALDWKSLSSRWRVACSPHTLTARCVPGAASRYGPSGTFHIPAQAPGQLVLIAAGSGITPLMSMIRTRLSDAVSDGRIDLLHSNRNPDEIIFGDELSGMEKGRFTGSATAPTVAGPQRMRVERWQPRRNHCGRTWPDPA